MSASFVVREASFVSGFPTRLVCTRFTFDVLPFTLHRLRFTFDVSPFTRHLSRFTFHLSPFTRPS